MSKTKARGDESYAAEERFHAAATSTVERAGFSDVAARKIGAVKVVDATAIDGTRLSFWVKLGWSGVPFAAVQFGMFKGQGGAKKTDAEFVQFVQDRVDRMRERGITHALLVHRETFALALQLDDVVRVYEEQMRRFPGIARNTKSPTMWIFDPRPNGHAEVAAIVLASRHTRGARQARDRDSRGTRGAQPNGRGRGAHDAGDIPAACGRALRLAVRSNRLLDTGDTRLGSPSRSGLAPSQRGGRWSLTACGHPPLARSRTRAHRRRAIRGGRARATEYAYVHGKLIPA